MRRLVTDPPDTVRVSLTDFNIESFNIESPMPIPGIGLFHGNAIINRRIVLTKKHFGHGQLPVREISKHHKHGNDQNGDREHALQSRR